MKKERRHSRIQSYASHKNRIVEFLATGFYLGRLPWAPGTWGTLGGVVIFIAMRYALLGLSPLLEMFFSVVLILVAVVIAELYESQSQVHDPGEVVIDEIVGFLIAMTWIPVGWISLLLGFVLFRLFDILKPPPISWVDERLKGGIGTILDDVLAGLIVNVLMQVIYQKTSLLGSQWQPLG